MNEIKRTAMRTSGVFVLGAIIGAVVMWLWGREMETYVEETAGKVLDRGGEALRRADDFLQDTKAHMSEALRVGQEAMRPAPAAETQDHARADSAVKPVLPNRSDACGGAVVRS